MRALGDRDAAVTGIGVVTPLGSGVEASWQALLAGRSAVRDVGRPSDPPGTRLAALVEPPYLRVEVPDALQSQAKFLNGSGEMLATAVAEAMARAGPTLVAPERRGFFLAQGDNERSDCLDFRPAVLATWADSGAPVAPEALNRASMSHVKPWYLLVNLLNNSFSLLSAWWDLRGSNTSSSGWTATSSYMLSLAARTIAGGDADAALVGGAARTAGPSVREEMAELGLGTRGADGASSYRPLDRRRDGAVPSEGAGALWLETWKGARERGADVLAVVAGTGSAWGSPGPGSFGPPAEALHAAAREALEEAGVEPSELLGVVLPGVGTPAGDAAALEAADRLLGSSGVPVTAWKGALGIAACASDAMEAALAVRGLVEGVLAGTSGFEEPDPAHARRAVARAAVRRGGRAVLQLAGGLDGQAAATCLVRP